METILKQSNLQLNKSFLTNFISLLIIVIGYSPISGTNRELILAIGYFAISGAITNWLAIHMLFEKIPLLYGSGIIPARFKEFKKGIKELIMGQFFTQDNINNFITKSSSSNTSNLNPEKILEIVNFDKIFEDLLKVIETSSLGGMLAMFGGTSALEGLRAPFKEQMKITISDITKSPEFDQAIKDSISASFLSSNFSQKIEVIVDKRLEELTPQMVKDIIQKMIREHLGWLVVWGGVFGGFIGLFVTTLK